MSTIDWNLEVPLIETASRIKEVDPMFVRTIRQIEHGAEGREFGVLSHDAPSYADQLASTVASIAHRLVLFAGNPLARSAAGRVVYSDRWIAYFGSAWAPIGVDNDPHGLNKNWVSNCISVYHGLTEQ